MRRSVVLCCFLLMIPVVWTESDDGHDHDHDHDHEEENGVCKDGKDEYCGKCESDKCTTCYKSYSDENGQCKEPTTTIENCLIYSSATACLSCDLGYSGDNCTAISISNCGMLSLTESSKCAFCNGVQEAETNETCSGDACTIENCYTCSGTGEAQTCSSCSAGYELSSDKKSCAALSGDYVGCTTNSSCSQCRLGYYVSSASTESTIKCTESTRYKSSSILGSLILGLIALINIF